MLYLGIADGIFEEKLDEKNFDMKKERMNFTKICGKLEDITYFFAFFM